MMSAEMTKIAKCELFKKKIYDSDFKGYRTLRDFVNRKHKFQINWPKAERGKEPIQIGVCSIETVDNRTIVKDAWLWELPSKRLLRHEVVSNHFVDKLGYSPTQYPVEGFKLKSAKLKEPESFRELPSNFGMILDLDEGTLSFRIGDQVLGVAFKDDLKEKHLVLAFFAKKPDFKVTIWELNPETNRS